MWLYLKILLKFIFKKLNFFKGINFEGNWLLKKGSSMKMVNINNDVIVIYLDYCNLLLKCDFWYLGFIYEVYIEM